MLETGHQLIANVRHDNDEVAGTWTSLGKGNLEQEPRERRLETKTTKVWATNAPDLCV
jgi:hypothetical protein